MKIEEMEEYLNYLETGEPNLFFDINEIRKLIAVAKAAKNEALRWNEELCSSTEYDASQKAWEELDNALEQLEGKSQK